MDYISYKKVEDFILSSFGSFAQATTGVSKLFLLDNDWPKISGDYIGMQILTIDDDGWGQDQERDVNGNLLDTVNFRVVIEIIAIREKLEAVTNAVLATPMSTLWQLNHSLKGDRDSKYKYLYSKDIGFLECTNPTRVDTVLDGISKEKRARMTVFLHCSFKDNTIANPINPIEKVFANASVYPYGNATTPDVIQNIEANENT